MCHINISCVGYTLFLPYNSLQGKVSNMQQCTKRAAIYARTATVQELGPNFALAEQIHQSRQFCVRNGYTEIYVYAEVGSGNNRERHGLQTVLAEAEQGKFDILVVHTFSRLARDIALLTTLLKRFETAGVKVESVTEDADLLSMVAAMYEEVSKMQSQRIAARSKAARLARSEQTTL